MSGLLFMLSLMFMIMDYTIMIEYIIMYLYSMNIIMIILFDWMSMLFMSFVLFISSMVILYSKEYMENDLNMNRFIMLIMLFILSMMLLIISPNLISILLGWDGLGLVSYCLIIYYQNIKSYNAGMMTALMNRLGDVAFLISISWMMNYGSWNYYFYLEIMKMDKNMNMVTILMILAAMTKSAQIPFSSWLPAAMAAPTPVSSLVHSSTLVTAGVYLMIRFMEAMTLYMLNIMLFFSILTMFMAGLSANYEFDLKKIIALSTLSQLGLMLSIFSLKNSHLAYYHMLTHALFKATLFMCAGYMIHMAGDCQDIRFFGSMYKYTPIVGMLFFISNMSLCGLPFLSGFYSKDLILEIMSMNYMNMYIYLIYFISTGLTVSYTIRLIYYCMFNNMNYMSLNLMKEYKSYMLYGMFGLIMLVMLGGSMLMWMLFPFPYYICLPIYMKLLTIMVIMLGMWVGNLLSQLSMLKYKYYWYKEFNYNMWNLNIMMSSIIYYPIKLGDYLYYIDQSWFEYYGSKYIYKNLMVKSNFFIILFSNNFKIYMMLFLFWVYIIIYLFYLNSL
uniref:NADH-ubiquinone oxidoreductase chain 5 n=1 Tax=Scydmaeninae sp. BMNH 1274313 TaxID=1796549 RepID=A0A126TE14_9COLE|nr:NADH dehydrogenase subunit 5 [Scydmaeninae sp. BMNH 1274313]